MPNTEIPKPPPTSDHPLTVASIAAIAYVFADLAHQGVGHGLGFYFAGGKSCMLTTTHLVEWITLADPQWRIFELGGPAGNIVLALLAWLGLRLLRKRPIHLKLFLWLVLAFNLFWAIGYLIFCGFMGRGDWMALLPVTKYVTLGRILFVVLGIVLYYHFIRFFVAELRSIFPVGGENTKARVSRLIWLSYICGGLIACAGATLDPQGPLEILRSGALSSFGAAMGLLLVARSYSRLPETQASLPQPVARHLAWILAAVASSLYYIAILGPGILMYFEH